MVQLHSFCKSALSSKEIGS